MPETQPAKWPGHLPVSRLLAVAKFEDAVFNDDEFSHLKTCEACFDLWTKFINDIYHDEAKKTSA